MCFDVNTTYRGDTYLKTTRGEAEENHMPQSARAEQRPATSGPRVVPADPNRATAVPVVALAKMVPAKSN